jgi:hypothetical protein
VFRIGDPASFAHAMADQYRLKIVNRHNLIILTDHDHDHDHDRDHDHDHDSADAAERAP